MDNQAAGRRAGPERANDDTVCPPREVSLLFDQFPAVRSQFPGAGCIPDLDTKRNPFDARVSEILQRQPSIVADLVRSVGSRPGPPQS
jgi:hypothetical protein